MIWIYFDASALVKRFSHEDGTALVNQLFQQFPTGQMTCSMIGALEIVSVLVRKRNDGRLSSHLFSQAMLAFKSEVLNSEAFQMTSVDDELMLAAIELVAKHGVNAADAIILRSFLNLNEALVERGQTAVLWSCDKRLLRATRDEGAEVFDPESETEERLVSMLSH